MPEPSASMDCYWFIDKNIINAMCVECHKAGKDGWYWPGEEKGYGDYDLDCSICGRQIFRRSTNVDAKPKET